MEKRVDDLSSLMDEKQKELKEMNERADELLKEKKDKDKLVSSLLDTKNLINLETNYKIVKTHL